MGTPLQSTDAGFAYDAMWTIATALNRSEEYFKKMKPSLSIKNFTYMSKAMTEHFKNAINETNIIGVTVSIIKHGEGVRVYLRVAETIVSSLFVLW